jgi:hypothetical protein
MQRSKGSTTFNCFSPPVMLATLTIESILTLYTVIRYRMNVVGRLIAGLLIVLGTFQLAEYNVCTGHGFSAEQWSRLGYVAITMLPALGLHLLHVLADKKQRKLVVGAYLTMLGFIVYFLTYKAAFIGYKCTGNYVIFQIGVRPAIAYGAYYYGLLATGIGLGARWANQVMRDAKEVVSKRRLQVIRALIIGYLIFIVPTAVSNTVKPSTRAGIPSIMCGFAVLFALILTLYILPRAGTQRHKLDTISE